MLSRDCRTYGNPVQRQKLLTACSKKIYRRKAIGSANCGERDWQEDWPDARHLAINKAKTVVAPLERVKVLFQTAQPGFAHHTARRLGVFEAIQIIRKSYGNKALFQGHSLMLLRIFPYAAINFLAYDQFRNVLISGPDKDTPIRRFISGSLAGAISTSCTYPFELVRVNLAVQIQRTSLAAICNQIYHHGGSSSCSAVTNFYRGYVPALLGVVPYAGMSFLAHDLIGDWFRSPALAPYMALAPPEHSPHGSTKQVRLTAGAELLSGGLAGLAAQTFCYPLEIIRRRMQVNRQGRIPETARIIFTERGIRGFYVGLTIGFIKDVPTVAISFFVYDRLRWCLGVD
ncbi:mitochondrial carrier [Aspergillus affinis]|uniref:mitochondrial carrier n=1 Tax=Aspergillus affinis TaxID=1070780 RepID=UPI0022FF0F73|nr:mitochondrial carrier [Aspergillus affinis]KAI9043096.1 mitochondrial carrier [Aspergillus affinis]